MQNKYISKVSQIPHRMNHNLEVQLWTWTGHREIPGVCVAGANNLVISLGSKIHEQFYDLILIHSGFRFLGGLISWGQWPYSAKRGEENLIYRIDSAHWEKNNSLRFPKSNGILFLETGEGILFIIIIIIISSSSSSGRSNNKYINVCSTFKWWLLRE